MYVISLYVKETEKLNSKFPLNNLLFFTSHNRTFLCGNPFDISSLSFRSFLSLIQFIKYTFAPFHKNTNENLESKIRPNLRRAKTSFLFFFKEQFTVEKTSYDVNK